jgi:hypothetical protein
MAMHRLSCLILTWPRGPGSPASKHRRFRPIRPPSRVPGRTRRTSRRPIPPSVRPHRRLGHRAHHHRCRWEGHSRHHSPRVCPHRRSSRRSSARKSRPAPHGRSPRLCHSARPRRHLSPIRLHPGDRATKRRCPRRLSGMCPRPHILRHLVPRMLPIPTVTRNARRRRRSTTRKSHIRFQPACAKAALKWWRSGSSGPH